MTTPAPSSVFPDVPVPTTPAHVWLDRRAVIGVEGADGVSFLQGLVSNDVTRVSADTAIWAAFLTPQGKYLHDFFIAKAGNRLLIDCEKDRLPDLLRRLSMYKLRAAVNLTDLSEDFAVAVALGAASNGALELDSRPGAAVPLGAGVAFVDPRHDHLGSRILVPRDAQGLLETAIPTCGTFEDYETLRISLGIPDGPRDLREEKSILLENGFDELHGVDWDKGCYMGQELTARTKYRALVRKRLVPVKIDGPAPPPGTPIMAAEREAGEMRTHTGGIGLALLRLEFLDGDVSLISGNARLTPQKPQWAEF